MAVKKKRRKKRKSYYIPVGRKGHVKRGCGKRNWRRGGNAVWKCKKGKKHPYKKKR
jgi:ribosomal protein L37AE/L43A